MDSDGVVDTGDKCLLVANPDQRDTNGDQVMNVTDLGTMKTLFFSLPGPSCVAAAGD